MVSNKTSLLQDKLTSGHKQLTDEPTYETALAYLCNLTTE